MQSPHHGHRHNQYQHIQHEIRNACRLVQLPSIQTGARSGIIGKTPECFYRSACEDPRKTETERPKQDEGERRVYENVGPVSGVARVGYKDTSVEENKGGFREEERGEEECVEYIKVLIYCQHTKPQH